MRIPQRSTAASGFNPDFDHDDAPVAAGASSYAPRMTEGLIAALRAVVGRDAVVTDPGVMAAHEVDWTGRFRGRAVAVVRPRSAAEAGEVLLACGAAGVGVVPQG